MDRGDSVRARRARYKLAGRPGTLRLLEYVNHARAGTYAEAIALAKQIGGTPDVTATRKPGTLKYGFGDKRGTRKSQRTSVYLAALAGTMAKRKASHSPPSIAWPKVASRLTALNGSVRMITMLPQR